MQTSLLQVRPEMFGSHPPAAPTVQLDAALGKHPEDTNFDFHAFYDLAREVGLSDEQIADYTHIYSARPMEGEAGKYDQNTAMVSVPTCVQWAQLMGDDKAAAARRGGFNVLNDTSVPGIIRSVTIHEFGHYVDDVLGDTKRNVALRKLQSIGGVALIFGLGAGGLVSADTVPGKLALAGDFVLSLGVFIRLATQKGFTSDSIEGPAYRFEEQYEHVSIVHFDPTV